MGKRLIRIHHSHFATRKTDFVGKEGNVVLITSVVYPGFIVSFENDQLQLKDFGGKLHIFKSSEIYELVLDQIAQY
jgi:hypothetical protein